MIGNERHNGGPSNKRRSMRRPLLNISAAKKLRGVPSSAIRENESRNEWKKWKYSRKILGKKNKKNHNLRDDHIFLV